jgi:hypothetical protein
MQYLVTHEGPNNQYTVNAESISDAADLITRRLGRARCEHSVKRANCFVMWDRVGGQSYSKNGTLHVTESES